MNDTSGRFSATCVLWYSTIFLSLAMIVHTQHWFPSNIFGDVAKDMTSLSAIVIISFVSLLTLHTVSKENYPASCLFITGIIIGVSLSFSWAVNGASMILVGATGPIMAAGLAGCSGKTK